MTTLLGKLGTNFLTAAFVPAVWFVITIQLLFASLNPGGFESRLVPPISLEDSLVTLVFSLVIGFTLMGLNTFLYKLLEGYFLLERLPKLRRKHMTQSRKRQRDYEVRDRIADYLRDQNKNEQDREVKARRKQQIARLRQSSRDLKASFKQDYPSGTYAVLPTRFGNILKSSELYANENYRIDTVILWPRLIHVIAPEYYRKIDESNNGLAFIVNCMVLAFLLAIFSLGAAGYQAYRINEAGLTVETQTQYTEQVQAISREVNRVVGMEAGESAPVVKVPGLNTFFYLGGALFFLWVAWFFYNASLPAARQYGNLFRSAFDLFRFDLLTQLRLPLPKDENAEIMLWEQLSGFLALGELEKRRLDPFQYVHPPTGRSAQLPENED